MRCFVALNVPPSVRGSIGEAQDRVRRAAPDADVRWVPEAALHLTLVFLGNLPEDRLAEIGRALVAIAAGHGAVSLTARRVGAFPTLRRARVVWVGLEAGPALETLQVAIAAAMVPLGFPREEKPFRPHVTIGRVRTPRSLGALARAVEGVAATTFGTWTAEDVILYHSRVSSTGAAYETLVRVPLAV